MRRALSVLAIAALGLAAGVFSLSVARDDPGYSLAGGSAIGALGLLGAGWALIGCGLAFRWGRPGLFGPLLVAAGFAWFVAEWNNPVNGSALAFTAGLCLYAACAPIAGHAVLAYPRGRLRSRGEKATLAVSYVGGVLLLGVLPALLVDPRAEGCGDCPPNLLAVADRPDLADGLTRAGLYLGVGWATALALLAAARAARETAATRPVPIAGALYLAGAAATFAVSLERGVIVTGTLERRLWLGEAVALVAVALGVGWRWVRARRARSAVARLVIELAQSPPPGGLRGALARMVRDPDLAIGYPLDHPRRLVDAQGRPVELPPGRQRTRIVDGERTLAVLGHAPGMLDDDQLVAEVTAAARLALENERLHAEVSARVEALRASRARIVAAADAERQRLERDLHDGAQQRLVTLALSLRMLRTRMPGSAALTLAEEELSAAIGELRELAHGIFPTVLADDGFDAAVHALAEEGRVLLRISGLPDRRFDPATETAAYTVVADTVRAASGGVAVRAHAVDGILAVELEAQGTNGLDVGALEDRVGALDGSLDVVQAGDGTTTIRAELPCGS